MILSLLLLPAMPVTTVAAAATFYVDDALGTDNATQGTGPGVDAFKSIQYAIDDTTVVAGDTISVAAGTYSEQVAPVEAITLSGPNAGINPITGTRVTEAIIDSTGSDPTIDVAGINDVTIEGFTISSSTTLVVHSILVDGGATGAVISCNIIKNDSGGGGTQIALSVTDDCEISENLVTDGFIWLAAATNTVVSGNDVEGVTGAGCITMGGSENVTITGNSLHDASGGVIIMSGVTGLKIQANSMTDNNEGIAIDASVVWTEENFIHHNIITGSTSTQIADYADGNDIRAEWNWWGMTNSASINATTTGAVQHAPYLWGIPTLSTSEVDMATTATPSETNTGLTEVSVSMVGAGVTYDATSAKLLTVTTGTPATGTSFTSATGWEPLVYFDIGTDNMTAGNITVTAVCTEDVFGSLTGGLRAYYGGAWSSGVDNTWNNTTKTATATFTAAQLSGTPMGIGYDQWEGWTLVSVLPYIFIGVCLVGAVAFLAGGFGLGAIILLAIAIVTAVVGTGVIQGLMP